MQVRQAANVVDLLDFFAHRGTPATLAEIADGMGWPRSSTFNLVVTLVHKGFFYEPQQRGGFYPSPRWLSVSQTIAASDPLPSAVRQLADQVGNLTGETTAIGSVSGLSVIFLYVRESRQPIRYIAEVGTAVPLYASSAGRAMLAQMTPAERDTYYRKLIFEKYSDSTPMSIQHIENELKEAEARGYHQSESEYIPDLAGVSLPLQVANRRLSIVVAGPVSRCMGKRRAIAQTIKEAIAEMRLDTPLADVD